MVMALNIPVPRQQFLVPAESVKNRREQRPDEAV